LIQEYEVEQKFGKLEAGDLKYYPDQTKIDFDKKGKYVEYTKLDKKGKIMGKTIPRRENDKIVEEIEYDENGKQESIKKINHVSNNESHIIYDYKDYNDNKRTLKIRQYLKRGKLIRQDVKRYDKDILQDSSIYLFEYKKGKLKKQEIKEYSNDTLRSNPIFLFEYDKNGNCIEQQLDKTVIRYEYLEFDAKNNWIKRVEYKDDKPECMYIRQIEYY
jgi:hypothetical protein